jgi:hypothetical protein
MTEDQAKTKWCFAYTASHTNPRAESSEFDIEQGRPAPFVYHCIGSACMAWRWSEAKRTVAFLEAVQAHMQTQAKPNFNTALQAVFAEKGGAFERTEGVCGLAGEPK